MVHLTFANKEEINDNWLDYIAGEVHALSQGDEFAINNYIDREATNPDVQELLKNANLDDENDEPVMAGTFSLGFQQESALMFRMPDWIRNLFSRLKRKIKRIFCKVVGDLQNDGDINLKFIIKSVLVALIPALGLGGFPAAVLPIVVGLAALLLKYGYNYVCPV